MHIDWFVFFAQMVNFLILFWLLKRFLYGRIIGAIDAREARISAAFSEAERAREEAREAAAASSQRMEELTRASEELMNKARADAEAYRRELMERARQEVDLLQQRWIETLRLERENFFAELRRLTGAQVYAVTRQVLRELADMELEERILQVLAERIETLDGAEREKIRALTSATRRITVLSAFDIHPEARSRLDRTLDAAVGPGIAVDYQKSADMMSGCEFRIDGYKIAWSMRDYLDSLEEKFCRLLYAEPRGDDRQKGV